MRLHFPHKSIRFFIALMVGLAACLSLEHFVLKSTQRFELDISDWLMKRRNENHAAASEDIALVGVDENAVLKYDGAPPPRAVFAKLIEALDRSGTKTIALDFTFDMPREGTQALADASRDKENLVYGVAVDETFFTRDDLPPSLPQRIPFRFREQNDAPPKNYVLSRLPSQNLRPSIKHLGHIMLQPSVDGIIRHIPLLIKSGDEYYPALSLMAACLFKDIPLSSRGITVKWGKHIILDNQNGWRREIPIDGTGRMRINYIGGIGRFEERYSFWNLERELETGIGLDTWPDFFSHKLVLIGDEANRVDLIPTPFAKAFPGNMVHATAIDNILTAEFVQESPPGLTICLALCFSGMMVISQLWLFRSIQRSQLPYDSRRSQFFKVSRPNRLTHAIHDTRDLVGSRDDAFCTFGGPRL